MPFWALDLNPIKNVWFVLNSAVCKCRPKDLEGFCLEEWSKTPPKYVYHAHFKKMKATWQRYPNKGRMIFLQVEKSITCSTKTFTEQLYYKRIEFFHSVHTMWLFTRIVWFIQASLLILITWILFFFEEEEEFCMFVLVTPLCNKNTCTNVVPVAMHSYIYVYKVRENEFTMHLMSA